MHRLLPMQLARHNALISPWIRCCLWTFFSISLLFGNFAPLSLQAQTGAEGSTLPGTIPDDVPPTTNVLYLPVITHQSSVNPTPVPTPVPAFTAIPIEGNPSDRPAAEHPDLNLAIRSYVVITSELLLVNNEGPSDQHAPQLNGLFRPKRLPTFTAAHQIHDWDWACGEGGCQGNPLAIPPVSLLALATTPGEALSLPSREPEIYTGGYKAMVLYADTNRITLAYTRRDTAAFGYIVHIEDIVVDPMLLALYHTKNDGGRTELPALRDNEPFATAAGTSIKVAIRDTGTFMEPRSRKDWWKEY